MSTGSRPLRLALACGLAAALVGGAYAVTRHERQPAPPSASAPVPVVTAAAKRQDVPVDLTGIGTVTPFNTVTIRSRVDGALQQVLFHEGQDIAKGAPIAVIDPRTYEAALEQAEARLQQDQAALANTQLIFQRDAKLGRDAFVSQQTVDNEHSAVAQLEAQVAQDRAAIETARTELSYTQITAPIDGRAGLRLVDEGNIVHAADPTGLVVLNQIHPIAVISTLPQSDVATIRAALAAGPVAARAVSREDGTVLDTGSVEIIDNEIDPKSGTLRVKSTFANREDRLWPGQFVDVRLRVTTLTGVVTVPAEAVQRGPDGPFVYTVGADGRVAATPVTPGQIAEGIAVIKAGIAEGQEVVVQGQSRLAPGVTVRGKAQGG
ncbi:efflux RND transporter periplasmic adaptor subunit [Xanthobacter flavus]|uniref:efflux RND transporter periplasmic adaptor subunit n=1 Tax=Xanthobacter flavus TaxID=281 RepID=UPI001AE4D83C|nr:efflux RND transporter periplasmic adaptor subunit [Xanthobacter flavus]MBP2148679.1 multidrug efflux system membrane fusion protein [Xanthobacter flavus]